MYFFTSLTLQNPFDPRKFAKAFNLKGLLRNSHILSSINNVSILNASNALFAKISNIMKHF
jgi:hypothetical protein